MGRPTIFTQEIAEQICERLASGESLLRICGEPDLPGETTVYRWLESNQEFREKYARAREQQADHYASEIIDIANTPQEGVIVTDKGNGITEIKRADMIEHRRLQIDARKWYASKLAPKKYGDKVAVTGGDEGDKPVEFTVKIIGK